MATYYTSLATGNDSNPGTLAAPKRTLAGGIALLSAGDTLLVSSGIYLEGLTSCPSGTSWANPVRVAAAPGATVWLSPSAIQARALFLTSGEHYIDFDGINVDASVAPYGGVAFVDVPTAPHHIRFQHAEIIGNSNDGDYNFPVIVSGTVGGFELRYLTIHHSGLYTGANGSGNYGIYLSGSNSLIEYCNIYDVGSAAVQVYHYGGSADNNIVRNNHFHLLTQASHGALWGILVSGQNNQVSNNLIEGITVAGNGISLYQATGTKLWYNTVTHNAGTGVNIDAASSNTELRNNILYLNTGGNIVNSSGSTTQDHNQTADPLFVNPGAGDYRLQATSPAINAGVSVPVVIDLVGTTRPQSAAPDIGAYEYLPTAPPLTQTYYVAKTGLDGNSGSATAPRLTIGAGLALLQTGDTLIIRAGVYAESIRNSVVTGTDWTTPTRVMANPGDTVWLTPTLDEYAIFFDRSVHHIEFTGINLNAIHCTLGAVLINGWTGGNPHHVRLQNAEMIGNPAYGHAIQCAASTSGITGANEFLNLHLHGGGSSEAHDGIRLESADNLVSGCALTDLPGIAVHVVATGDTPNTNTITANAIHDLRATSAGQAHYGSKLDGGSGNIVTNNVIWNVPNDGGRSVGIDAYGGSAAAIYHNTVSACGEGIAIEAGHAGALVKNNIAYLNPVNDYRDDGGSFAVGTRVTGGADGSDATIVADAFVATAGNLLVAVFGASGAGATLVADTAGNTWHLAASVSDWRIYYAYNCLGHAANVVTATLAGAATYRTFCVRQFSGVPTTDPLLDGDGAASTDTSPVTPTLTIAVPAMVMEVIYAGNDGLTDSGPFTIDPFVIPGSAYFSTDGYFGDALALTSSSLVAEAQCSYGPWTIIAAAFSTSGAGATTATNLFGSDPSFVNAASGNFRLLTGSAAIDAGTNVGVTVDADGRARPVNAVYDIGAYEYAAAATVKRLTMMGVGR